MPYHKFDGDSYVEWDGLAKEITAEMMRSWGYEVMEEGEVYRHDVTCEVDGRIFRIECECRSVDRFNSVWYGDYTQVHVPARRYRYSDSDADWVISYPMSVIDGDARYYRVRGSVCRAAWEAGSMETIKPRNNGGREDDFLLVDRSEYQFKRLPSGILEAVVGHDLLLS